MLRRTLVSLIAVLAAVGCGGGGNPVEITVETLNVALAGAFIPYEAERRQPVTDAVAAMEADIVCLQEVWLQADKEAIRDAAAETFPYTVFFQHDLDTTVDDPTDINGDVPPPLQGVPCPDVDSGNGTTIQEQADATIECLAEFCSTTGDDQGFTTSAGCAADNCVAEAAPLLLGTPAQTRCYACAVTQLPTEQISVIGERCTNIENQDLAFRGQSGVMILSKYPLTNANDFVMPGSWNRRVVLSATATLPNGSELDVYCNHLTPIFSDFTFPYTGQYGNGMLSSAGWAAEQLLQAGKHNVYVQQTSGSRPAVIMGDLNAGRELLDDGGDTILFDEGSATLDKLEEVLTVGVVDGYVPTCTFCDTNPLNGIEDTNPVWIDHIYLYNLERSAVSATKRTFDGNVLQVDGDEGPINVPLSDHYGLQSVLTIP